MGVVFTLMFLIILMIIGIIIISTFLLGLILLIIGIIKRRKSKKTGKVSRISKILIIIGIILTALMSIIIIGIVDLFWVTETEEAESLEKKYHNSNTIMQALQTEDVELMKTVFAENVGKNIDLEYQITQMYEFVNGNIIDYDIGDAFLESTSDGYIKTQTYKTWEITEITTDSGNIYNLYFEECAYDNMNKDNEGVLRISVINEENKSEFLVGEQIEQWD